MSFVSLQFYGFLVALFIAYFIVYKLFPKAQWVVLLIGSYYFYMLSNPKLVFFLLLSTITTWGTALLISHQVKKRNGELDIVEDRSQKKLIKNRYEKRKHTLLFICLLINIGVLAFVKYANFAIDIISKTGLHVEPIGWYVLPLGLSFYTFQSVGYCIDVQREMVEPERNLFKYALFVSFFPQIAQGPIGRYNDLAPQLYAPRSFSYDSFTAGIERIIIGVFKKVFIANQVAIFVNFVYEYPTSFSGAILLLATFLYGIQLYADFSGYMDIALGTAQVLGIKMAENFNAPYFSHSIAEFWRRWHISLGTWFKDYLFYPILRAKWLSKFDKFLSVKLNKKMVKKITTAIGLFIMWFLVGLWHGADEKFVFYGLYHGMFIILSTLLADRYLRWKKRWHIGEDSNAWQRLQIIRTYIIVNMGYVFFRANSFGTAILIYKRISTSFLEYGLKGLQQVPVEYPEPAYIFWAMIIIGIMALIMFDLKDVRGKFSVWFHEKCALIRWPVLYIMLILIFFTLGDSSAAAENFLYFNF